MVIPLLVKLSLARWVQAQVFTNGFMHAGRDHFVDDDGGAAAKLHLVDEKGLVPSISLSAGASIPTPSTAANYTRTYDALFTAYVTQDFGRVHADLNFGANVLGLATLANVGGPAPEGPRTQPFFALALSTPITRLVSVMAETYAFGDAPEIAPRDGGFLFALAFTPVPWLTADFGGDIGYFPTTRAFTAFAGLTVLPAILW